MRQPPGRAPRRVGEHFADMIVHGLGEPAALADLVATGTVTATTA
jgi:hypothetical protein